MYGKCHISNIITIKKCKVTNVCVEGGGGGGGVYNKK